MPAAKSAPTKTPKTKVEPSPKDLLAQAKALGSSKDPFAIDTLIKLLDTRNEPLREAARASLKQLDAAPKLAERVRDSKLPDRNRQLAATGLRYLRDESTIPALVDALAGKSAPVRADAAFALSMIGATQAVEALLSALDDANKDVRYYAADALGKVKSPKVKAALEKRLSAESEATVQFSLKAAAQKQSR